MCVCAHNKLLFRGTLNFITSGGPVQSLGQATELALPTFASSLFCGLWKLLTTFVPQFSTYEMGKQCLIYLWFWHLKGTRIGFCLADNAGYMQDWRLLCAGSFGECSATSQTFGFQLFVGSAQMFEYKHLFFFFLSKQCRWCVLICTWYVTGHCILFREILYFTEVGNDILFMISWTLIPTSVRTPRWVESFHKQIAIAKAVLQGMFMKSIKCFMEHTWSPALGSSAFAPARRSC